jgi:hypothetical protein
MLVFFFFHFLINISLADSGRNSADHGSWIALEEKWKKERKECADMLKEALDLLEARFVCSDFTTEIRSLIIHRSSLLMHYFFFPSPMVYRCAL